MSPALSSNHLKWKKKKKHCVCPNNHSYLLTGILLWYILLQTSNESMHPCKSYWMETNILTQQQKLSPKRAITQPKFGGQLPISNLTCILQWYKLLQTLNKINASLQKLRKRKAWRRRRCITSGEIWGRVDCSIGCVHDILHDKLNMRRVHARWIPKMLSED